MELALCRQSIILPTDRYFVRRFPGPSESPRIGIQPVREGTHDGLGQHIPLLAFQLVQSPSQTTQAHGFDSSTLTRRSNSSISKSLRCFSIRSARPFASVIVSLPDETSFTSCSFALPRSSIVVVGSFPMLTGVSRRAGTIRSNNARSIVSLPCNAITITLRTTGSEWLFISSSAALVVLFRLPRGLPFPNVLPGSNGRPLAMRLLS